jgi:hypothetical protein
VVFAPDSDDLLLAIKEGRPAAYNEPEALDLSKGLFPDPSGRSLAEIVMERKEDALRERKRRERLAMRRNKDQEESTGTGAMRAGAPDNYNSNDGGGGGGSGAGAGAGNGDEREAALHSALLRLDTAAIVLEDVNKLLAPPTISVFMSSTFTDTRHENDALILHAYDWLRDYAAARGIWTNDPEINGKLNEN